MEKNIYLLEDEMVDMIWLDQPKIVFWQLLVT